MRYVVPNTVENERIYAVKKFVRHCIRCTKWTFIIAVVVMFSLLGTAPFYVYHQFSTETPIAKFQFSYITKDVYYIDFFNGDMCESSRYKVRGDQVQFDASFLKWQDWITLLGAEPMHRFERMSGRYRNIQDERQNVRTVMYMSPNVVFDPFSETPLNAGSNWLVSTQYGSSIYVDIDPTLLYTIYKTEDGMIVKSQSVIAFKEEDLVIDINPNCIDSKSIFEKSSKYVNDVFVSFFS